VLRIFKVVEANSNSDEIISLLAVLWLLLALKSIHDRLEILGDQDWGDAYDKSTRPCWPIQYGIN